MALTDNGNGLSAADVAAVVGNGNGAFGNWADGSWEAKKDLTKAYVAFLEDRRKKIGIAFIKVDAHTGIEYNERVDRIAKASLEVSDG